MLVLDGKDLSHLKQAAEILRNGGIVVFPTETVYGLGASAFDPQAVQRVFQVKNRPAEDPLIVHLAFKSHLKRVVKRVPRKAQLLASRFWPGPLTLVLEKRKNLPSLVTAGQPSVAVRVPSHPVARCFLRLCQLPVAAPSANTFGRLSPTRAEHVIQDLGEKVDAIIDGGQCPVGVESTIISFLEEPPKVLRPGGLQVEKIERVIGPIGTGSGGKSLAPGSYPCHYQPKTPLYLEPWLSPETLKSKRVGYLAFKKKQHGYEICQVLSPSGSLVQAAQRLYACLHKLDRMNLDAIVAELVPEKGLGRAINERLRKAARTPERSPKGQKL